MPKINNGDQTPKKTEIKSVVIKNTTSPEEKKFGSMNWIIICNVKEILKFDLDKNLRISYEDAVNKSRNSTHKAIYNSFDKRPGRFIQRHSGFTVVCDNLIQTKKEEYGINTIILENASLINGGQSQGEIKKWFEANKEASLTDEWDKTNIKIEVIVEKDIHEVHEISVARNDSTNVSDLSKLGNQGYFDDLNNSMVNDLGEEYAIQLSETDNKLSTQLLLQILRAMTPKSLKGETWSKDMVVAYSGKQKCLINYKERVDEEKSVKEKTNSFDPILDFYRSFAPQAWTLYEEWTKDKDWVSFWKKSDNTKRMGKYDEKNDSFELTWAIACPVLFGLQDFIDQNANGWKFNLPKTFDKKAFMNSVMEEFKRHKYVPQDFAKDRSTYLLLRDSVSEFK